MTQARQEAKQARGWCEVTVTPLKNRRPFAFVFDGRSAFDFDGHRNAEMVKVNVRSTPSSKRQSVRGRGPSCPRR